MSTSDFIEPSIEMSESAEIQLKAEDQAEKPIENPFAAPQDNCSDYFDGYAEFVNHMAQLRIPIFSNKYLLKDMTISVIGKGGTYLVRTAKLEDSLLSRSSRPFLLKASAEALAHGHAIESRTVEEGTNVVTKHIDFRTLKQRRAQGRLPASSFLKPFQIEATILSHHLIREHPLFPSLLGIGLESSPDDVGEMPQLYPYMIMELGRQGSLEQSMRELWYRLLQTAPGSPSQYDLNIMYRNLVIPWKWKLSIARSICQALCVLHHYGVVHGDVKLSNTLALISESGFRHTDQNRLELVMSGQGLAQLADFGSSILLSQIPVGAKARLRSHTPPWNAPESTSEIQRNDLIKTDIYSYGLLFGRIMLQGVSPFASETDVASLLGFGSPKHDIADIQRLQESDKVDEHIYEKIKATDFYSDEQLQVIRSVLQRTLRTKPKDRVGTLEPVRDFLTKCWTSGPEEAVARSISVLWDETKPTYPLSLENGFETEIQIPNLEDDNFIGASSASHATNIPDILDPIFADLRHERTLFREVFEDLKQQVGHNSTSDSRAGTVYYQIALCYYNAWGTPVDMEQCQTHLLKALSLGSVNALCLFQPVIGSPAVGYHYPTIEVEEMPELYRAMLTHFPGHTDICKAIQLQSISPELFQTALSKARSDYIEYTDGKRLNIVGLLQTLMEQVLGSGLKLADRMLNFDIYPEESECQEDYTDLPFLALCLAASQGHMDSILKLVSHVQDKLGFATEEYLNRSTNSLAMDFRLLKIDKTAQSATDVEGPLPALSFKLEEHTRPLMMASSNGHSDVVLVLLAHGADPTQVDSSGRCPLHYLARFDPDEVEEVGDLLLEGQPASLINTVDKNGYTPLAFVLDTEKNWIPDAGVTAARYLLQRGATWYDRDKPTATLTSPFVKAVQSLNIQAMKLVKEFAERSIKERPKGDDDRQFDEKQETMEVTDGSKAKYLIIHGDELDSYANNDTGYVVDYELSTFQSQILNSIMILAREPDSVLFKKESTYGTTLAEVIQLLIGSTDTRLPAADIAPVVRHVVKLGAVRVATLLSATLPSLDWSSDDMCLLGDSMALTTRNFPHMLATLSKLGYQIDQVAKNEIHGTQYGRTFFHLAAYYRTPVELVEHICQVSSIDYKNTESEFLSSPMRLNAFDMAIILGHFTLADYLIHQGADFKSPHLYGFRLGGAPGPPVTILGYLLSSVIPEVMNTPRRGETLRYLLKLNPDPLVCPGFKQNVFHLVWRKWAAVEKDYFHPETELEGAFDEVMAAFEQLHEHFADASLLSARDVDGATPLHHAARSGNIRGVQRLLILGVVPNAKDNDGRSPMAYAVMAIHHALNYTVTGDVIPDEIKPEEVMGPILELYFENWGAMGMDPIAQSVVLSRVLESIRKRRQAENDSDGAVFRTRREEPTEILVLIEIFAYLWHFCRLSGLEDDEVDGFFNKD